MSSKAKKYIEDNAMGHFPGTYSTIYCDQAIEAIEMEHKECLLLSRDQKISLLEKYTKFLQNNGYIDTDATCEEPFAIDEFLKTQ